MQTCVICNAISSDTSLECSNCKSSLVTSSQTAVSLNRLRKNTRVSAIRISGNFDACPACQKVLNTYSKEETPVLPVQGCSHPNGCRCFYEPVSTVAALISRVVK